MNPVFDLNGVRNAVTDLLQGDSARQIAILSLIDRAFNLGRQQAAQDVEDVTKKILGRY